MEHIAVVCTIRRIYNLWIRENGKDPNMYVMVASPEDVRSREFSDSVYISSSGYVHPDVINALYSRIRKKRIIPTVPKEERSQLQEGTSHEDQIREAQIKSFEGDNTEYRPPLFV